jgi:hypothetical protein
MSVTTTENPITYALHSTLQDYDIHVTGANINDANIDPSPNVSATSALVQNPPHWPRDHHRIPDYRPVNRHLNVEERPRGSNGIERTFLLFMFTGVALNAVSCTQMSIFLGKFIVHRLITGITVANGAVMG